MSQAIERVAAISFLLLAAALPWSIAPMSIGVALCGALTLAAWWRPAGARWCHTPVDFPAIGWIAALAIATIASQNPSESAGRITKGLLPAIVAVAAYHGRDPKLARRAIAVLLISAAAATVFALTWFVAHGGAFPARVRGAVGHPLTYGGQAMLLATIAMALLLRSRDRRWKIAALALLTLVAPALLGSFTRSAWIGTVVAFAVILAGTRARWLAALAAALVVLLVVLPPGYRERALSAFDPASHWNVERVRLWTAGWKIFRDHPIAGVGLQDLHSWIERYHSPEPHEPHGHLHSIYVQIAATMGVVGLAAFGWLTGGLFRTAGRGLRADLRAEGAGRVSGADGPESLGGFAIALRLAAVAALAGFLVAGLFEWNFGDEELLDFLFTLVGLAFAASAWGRTWAGAPRSS